MIIGWKNWNQTAGAARVGAGERPTSAPGIRAWSGWRDEREAGRGSASFMYQLPAPLNGWSNL